jgi:hypothetical protein
MKSFVWLATLSLLVLGMYCGAVAPLHQTAQAAVLTEGSFPAPEMHKGSPEQLAAERGEGSYPTPCSPGNPRCKPAAVPTLQAGEGSYPTPCSPGNPRCKPAAVPTLQAGEGSYPTPCSPGNPRCKPAAVPTLQAGEGSYPTPCSPGNPRCKPAKAMAYLGEGSAPAPFEMPGGLN